MKLSELLAKLDSMGMTVVVPDIVLSAENPIAEVEIWRDPETAAYYQIDQLSGWWRRTDPIKEGDEAVKYGEWQRALKHGE